MGHMEAEEEEGQTDECEDEALETVTDGPSHESEEDDTQSDDEEPDRPSCAAHWPYRSRVLEVPQLCKVQEQPRQPRHVTMAM